MTLVNVDATIVAVEAGLTKTLEAVIHVGAFAAISAGFCQAKVDSFLTNGSGVSSRAFALELFDAIDTRAAILARIAMAVVDVLLAVDAFEASRAMTLVLVAAVRRALSTVETWIRTAVLYLKFAVSSTETGCALALKALTRVATAAAMKTWLARARHCLRLAMLADPSVPALA